MRKIIFSFLVLCLGVGVYGQYSDEHKGGFRIKFDENGSKYLQAILFGQFWFQDFEGSNSLDGFSVRRARLLTYSQINERLLFVFHLGINSLNGTNMSPTGSGGENDIFVHDAWGEYNIIPELQVGAGLHYWGGISRLNNASTLNFLTMDNNRSSWSTLGLSDQFGRHVGVYAKGKIGKFQYRASMNSTIKKTLDGNSSTIIQDGEEKYLGRALLDKGKYAYAAYLEYQFLDSESNFLPYKVGTYLGTKKVLNVGAGIFHQGDGIVKNNNGELEGKDVTQVAADVFYDSPLGESGGAVTAYASYQYSDMGDRYLNGRIYGEGSQFYAHAGYLIPKKSKDGTHVFKNRIQPYVAYSHRDFKALDEAAKELRIGGNWYVDGQNARITVEYQKSFDLPSNMDDQISVQAMIYF